MAVRFSNYIMDLCDFSKVLWFIFVFGVNAFDGTGKHRRGYVSNVVTYNDLDDLQQQEMQQPPLGLFQDLWLASSQKQTQTAQPVPYNYETTHTVQANEHNDNDNHNNLSNEFHKEFYKENTDFNNGDDVDDHNDDKPIPFAHDTAKKPKQRNRVRLLPMPMKPEEFYHPVQHNPAKLQNAPSVGVDMNPKQHHIVPNVYEYQNGVVPRQPTNEMDSDTFILGGPFDQTPHTKGMVYVSSPADNDSGGNSNSHGGGADDDGDNSSESDDSDDSGGDELFQMMPDQMTNIEPGHLVGTKIRVAATPTLEVYFSKEQNRGRNF